MSLIETLGINVVLLSFLMYIDFNYFNFNFNFILMYIDFNYFNFNFISRIVHSSFTSSDIFLKILKLREIFDIIG